MKNLILACFILFSAVVLRADDFTTTDGTKYTNVTVSRTEPDGLVVVTDSGIQKIPFTSLPKETQLKYGYDAQKAAAYSAQVAAAQHQLFLKNQQAQAAQAQTSATQGATQEQLAAVTHRPDPGITSKPGVDVMRIKGKVLQVLPDGILLTDLENETLDPYKDGRGIWHGGANEMDGTMLIVGVDAKFVDDDPYEGVVYPAGRYSYTSTIGATKTVLRYATTPELAVKYLNAK
jgi:hypothetical protein